jgi:polyvinyl alcohol dehydrogenase (cytochrome)
MVDKKWEHAWRGLALATAMTLCLGASISVAADSLSRSSAGHSDWPMFGQNLRNTANGVTALINSRNVNRLKPKWVFTTAGDVSARAAVVGGGVYFPDWGGQLYRLDAATGAVVWSRNLMADYGFVPAPGSTKVVARTSPTVEGDTVYIGTLTTASGAHLLAIDKSTGALRWKTQLDSNPLSVDDSSPIIFDGVIYLGVASVEEGAAIDPAYHCCSFRGSVLAVNAATGVVIWQQYTIPPGYSGGGVPGSTIIPDPARGQIYVTTGNQYSTPTDPAFVSCVGGTKTEEKFTSCLSGDDHIDSVLALDMKTGSVRWSHRLSNADEWNGACLSMTPGQGNCPDPKGGDYDFASMPNLFVIATPQGPREVVGAGQKSDIYATYDPATGRFIWATQVGPTPSLGPGIEWGSATDGQRIYVAVANLDGVPTAVGHSGGFWSALDARSGKVLWQTPDPNGAADFGPVSVANGVVYAGSLAGAPGAGNMLALDARTGAILWSYPSGGSVSSGASIAGDTVFWGSGYTNLPFPGLTGNNKFYAFSLDGK